MVDILLPVKQLDQGLSRNADNTVDTIRETRKF